MTLFAPLAITGHVSEAHMAPRSAAGLIRRLPARLLLLALAIAIAGLVAPPSAWGHGEGDSDQSLVLVRQAIAFLVNKPGDSADVEDKINDALEAPDKAGVNLTVVKQAMDALDAGDMVKVRQLLQSSIGARPYAGTTDPVQIGKVPPALTGADTGTLAALDPLPGRGGLNGGDWVLLAISVVVGLVGVALSVRLRPQLPRPPKSAEVTGA